MFPLLKLLAGEGWVVDVFAKMWSASTQPRTAAPVADDLRRAVGTLTITVDRPDSSSGSRTALEQFLRRSRSWTRERIAIPLRVRRLLWGMVPIHLIWSTWLALVLAEVAPCEGSVCTVVTLDGRAALLLICSISSLVVLVGVAASTRGLRSSNCGETAWLTAAAGAGGVALLGITALLWVVALVLMALAVLFGIMTLSP